MYRDGWEAQVGDKGHFCGQSVSQCQKKDGIDETDDRTESAGGTGRGS